ncbi:hypothetical protein BVY02_01610, partial [bacterium J17]
FKALEGSSIVIEAVIEDMAVKKQVLSEASRNVDSDAILASNTSSLSITELADNLEKPERVLGMHFFNPAEKMPLVEIVKGEKSSERAISHTAALTSMLGKFPIVVNNVPGFLVNRILTPYLVEASHLLSEGHSIVSIDSAALDFGMPMGPFRLLDEVGLDVAAKVSAVLEEGYGDRMSGPTYAEQLVSLKRMGKKSGKGFYIYQGRSSSTDSELSSILQLPESPQQPLSSKELANRLVLRLVNEAVCCLDEGVCSGDPREAAGQVDLGSVMGIGFAPFRGGIIYYAEQIGAKELHKRLSDLSKKHGDRYSPSPGIIRRAESNSSFYA